MRSLALQGFSNGRVAYSVVMSLAVIEASRLDLTFTVSAAHA
jgi:hypothetical protein